MRKLTMLLALSVGLALSACQTLKIDPTQPPPSAEQVAAAKAAVKQANFDKMCQYARGGFQLVHAVVSVPQVAAKLGDKGLLAVQSLNVLVDNTCSGKVDVNNADTIIQAGYDTAGQVLALVLAAQSAAN